MCVLHACINNDETLLRRIYKHENMHKTLNMLVVFYHTTKRIALDICTERYNRNRLRSHIAHVFECMKTC